MKRTTLIGLILGLLVLVTACSSSGKTNAANGPAKSGSSATSMTAMAQSPSDNSMTASNATIHIKNFAFVGPGQVSPGQKITIHNEDGEAHTVTSDTSGAFDVNVPASSIAVLTAPTKPGTYKFHCNFHGQMHGTLTVG